ncbi:formyltetrahydrofolate deformylase [Phreatobacter stygius]|uniref:Formyltetrahydrofolate deformylase n=1 Tax=Phreatobacter stygius TaxID=1940610 RepID=A0A4D7BCX1_9HYPH|nr:formyltetrahydrofolate deformylase [Phreatobacter stygius]QCI68443.1 formyltetrahydrofolate deformylase [Phreatobacter stygius]
MTASTDRPALQPAFVLTLVCRDRVGIVAAVSRAIADKDCNITESAQFGDPATGMHFMRLVFTAPAGVSAESFTKAFAPVADHFAMTWRLWDAHQRPRVVILVSRHDHCLVDLIYRWRLGSLPMDIVSIVSNHDDARALADQHGIAFHHLPVTRQTKASQEAEIIDLIGRDKADLVILARYMQILSDTLTARLAGQCINIHHSFLPSFKGAAPYSQAHARGVKLIGATAHYVTSDLDEGPIIEQETERVTHAMSVDEFVAIGREIEARVLARAVKMHVEHRVFQNGGKTVVFR